MRESESQQETAETLVLTPLFLKSDVSPSSEAEDEYETQ
jgi:hypothetical protein